MSLSHVASWLTRKTDFSAVFQAHVLAPLLRHSGPNCLCVNLQEQLQTNGTCAVQGPSIDSPFWLYLITWYVSLFVTLLLGQIGVQGRKQGYFPR